MCPTWAGLLTAACLLLACSPSLPPSATETITPERGGTLETALGTLVIPPGAVPYPVNVSLSESCAVPPDDFELRSTVIELAPVTLELDGPAKLAVNLASPQPDTILLLSSLEYLTFSEVPDATAKGRQLTATITQLGTTFAARQHVCGDGTCNSSHNCQTCPEDCGPCAPDCEQDSDCPTNPICSEEGTGTCVDYECAYTNFPAGTPCDDSDVCTVNTTCDGNGACVGEPTCADPPPNECIDGDTVFRSRTVPGVCEGAIPSCIDYTRVDIPTADCAKVLAACEMLDCIEECGQCNRGHCAPSPTGGVECVCEPIPYWRHPWCIIDSKPGLCRSGVCERCNLYTGNCYLAWEDKPF